MGKTRMREIIESGFKITAPEDMSFRLRGCLKTNTLILSR